MSKVEPKVAAKEPEFKPVIFWAAAKLHRIDGFVKEIKVGGHIDRSAEDIRFDENVFTAKTLEEAKFIRGSRNFGSQECMEVKTMKEARDRTLGQQAKKNEVLGKPILINAEKEQDFSDK